MKPVRVDEAAQIELDEAAVWYEQKSPGLGKEFTAEIRQAFRLIRQRPGIGAPAAYVPAELHVQRLIMRRFPYSIYYSDLEEEIRIHAIAHAKRRPEYWQDRLESG